MIYQKTMSKGGRLGIISLSEMLLKLLGLLNIIDQVKEEMGLAKLFEPPQIRGIDICGHK